MKEILIEASPCPPEQKSSFPSAVSALHGQSHCASAFRQGPEEYIGYIAFSVQGMRFYTRI